LTALALPLPSPTTGWIRNLCAEGLESNPGPGVGWGDISKRVLESTGWQSDSKNYLQLKEYLDAYELAVGDFTKNPLIDDDDVRAFFGSKDKDNVQDYNLDKKTKKFIDRALEALSGLFRASSHRLTIVRVFGHLTNISFPSAPLAQPGLF
jgi:hypothetical protein